MRKNTGTKDGFRPRAPQPKKLRADNTRFDWVGTPEGRIAKTLLGVAAQHKAGTTNLLMEREFRAAGVTARWLEDTLRHFLPWFPELYLEARGVPLTRGIVYDRWHKQMYQNGRSGVGGKPHASTEYFAHSARLRPLVARVEDMYRVGAPVTRQQAIEMGTL